MICTQIILCIRKQKNSIYTINMMINIIKFPHMAKFIKIIDFGRAIYKFKGNIVCSDSFHPKGDAATQYNCEPYLNSKKPRLEPKHEF